MKKILLLLPIAISCFLLVLFFGVVRTEAQIKITNSLIVYVSGDGNCGGAVPCYSGIQEAIDNTNCNDEIRVAAGIYSDIASRTAPIGYSGPTTLNQIAFISKTLIIRGGYTVTNWIEADPVFNPTTLDAQELGRVLFISGDISVTVDGLNIVNGNATGLGGGDDVFKEDSGGGIYIDTASVYIQETNVAKGLADKGGGAYVKQGFISIFSSVIENNTAKGSYYGSGGGIYAHNSQVELVYSNLQSNSAVNGDCGGVYLHETEALVDNSQFQHNSSLGGVGGGGCFIGSSGIFLGNEVISNTADFAGGGVHVGESKILFEDNLLKFNKTANNSYGAGGGIHISQSIVTMTNNVLLHNLAIGAGGGIDILYDSYVVGERNLIIENTGNYGGGIAVYGSTALLSSNVVNLNTTNVSGSGVFVSNGDVFINHITIAGNKGGDGSGIYASGYASGISNININNSIVTSQTIGILTNEYSAVDVDSVLVWENNENFVGEGIANVTNIFTGTPSFRADGYHIKYDSVAIDKGIDTGSKLDIDGETRPIGLAYDLGADELLIAPQSIVAIGPDNVRLNQNAIFTATVEPITVTTPLSYNWTITDFGPITHTGDSTDTMSIHWTIPGSKTLTIEASNSGGIVTTTVTVLVEDHIRKIFLPLLVR